MDKFSLNELKLAIINNDIGKIIEISNKEPAFSSTEEAQEILSFINKANEILKKEKLKIFKNMQEVKKLQKYYQEAKKDSFNIEG
ncbi:MAG: hypothetical protein ABGX25_07625 [Nautiliaceae bacterium]